MFQKSQIIWIFVLFCHYGLSESGTILQSIELSDEDKQFLLDEHNRLRRATKPAASNMLEMVWDPKVAAIARDYSRLCDFEHSPRGMRKTVDFPELGENIFITSKVEISNREVSEGVQLWFDEIEDYSFQENSCAAGKVCGHYTQIVWANSYAVGCGITSCEDVPVPGSNYPTASLLVCNYGPAGNFQGVSPYTSGSPCSACPSGFVCEQDLCRNETRSSDFSEVNTGNNSQTRTSTSVALVFSQVLISFGVRIFSIS